MSNIRFESKNMVISCLGYKEILQNKINEVCKRIGFRDDDVTWIIFKPKMTLELGTISIPKFKPDGEDYAYCDVPKREIWISTLAISSATSDSIYRKFSNISRFIWSQKADFLAVVIIDEITHLQTNCGHNTCKYDNKFRENIERFFRRGLLPLSSLTNHSLRVPAYRITY